MKISAKNAKVDAHFLDNCYSALQLLQPGMKTAQSQEEGDVWDFFVGRPDGKYQRLWQGRGGALKLDCSSRVPFL